MSDGIHDSMKRERVHTSMEWFDKLHGGGTMKPLTDEEIVEALQVCSLTTSPIDFPAAIERERQSARARIAEYPLGTYRQPPPEIHSAFVVRAAHILPRALRDLQQYRGKEKLLREMVAAKNVVLDDLRRDLQRCRDALEPFAKAFVERRDFPPDQPLLSGSGIPLSTTDHWRAIDALADKPGGEA